jgi:mannose/fructose/N-acetylgalactosamine-specific phosphotransferase system component IIB
MSNNENMSLTNERKDIQVSIRLCEKDFMELKRISPKNVSYAIRKLIRDQKTNK